MRGHGSVTRQISFGSLIPSNRKVVGVVSLLYFLADHFCVVREERRRISRDNRSGPTVKHTERKMGHDKNNRD